MPEQLRILVDDAGTLRNFLWLNVNQTPDGAVSVGFADREFRVPGLSSEVEVDEHVHVQLIDLTGKRAKHEVTNPHFTFHPPNRLHLRANRKPYLAEQVVMMDLQLLQVGRIAWLTFVSKRVTDLALLSGAQPSGREVVLHPATSDCSIEFSIDFIHSLEQQQQRTGELLDRVETWPSANPQSMVTDWFLHLTADPTIARASATFTWHQQT